MDIAQYAASSYLSGDNAPYIEELYEEYLDNPEKVPRPWRRWFDQLQDAPASDGSARRDIAATPVAEAFAQRARTGGFVSSARASDLERARKQVSVQSIVAAYRFLGTRWAELDPLRRRARPQIPELEPAFYGLAETDMDTVFHATDTYFGADRMTLREIISALRQTYCSKIGCEFMYISDPEQKRWWQERLESVRSQPRLEPPERRHILELLTAAEGFEQYMDAHYAGQTRYSLEGGESVIVAMDRLVSDAARRGTEEIVIGMAHRGRLNVLASILGKPPTAIFAEFEGSAGPESLPAGDVRHHTGFSANVATASGPIHLSLAFNPAHPEAVDPVAVGSVRARQDLRGDALGARVLGVLVHGDAAFSGQGIVMETLNLADTRGFGTGGTIHIVINNQIGFTTSDPRDKGSMTYCTDPAKLIEAPVVHVNGDDPDSVAFATQLAMDYRAQFHRDVVVDVVGFRRLGHNEQDTPSVTQPLMYKRIAAHPGTRRLYAGKLASQGVIEAAQADSLAARTAQRLAAGLSPLSIEPVAIKNRYALDWTPYMNHKWTDAADTAVPISLLRRWGEAITEVPGTVRLHPVVDRLVKQRRLMVNGDLPCDWGMAEHLAFASLLASGCPVRISGEDSGRGAFGHRHAVLHDQDRERWNEGDYVPLEHVCADQAPFTVIDSVLSETAVLGFEYGYASARPDALVIWEARCGDFANVAQDIIDQFISSAEVKWGRQSGLVLFLPHGYEGEGPEHSSARIERFLQLAAENNMQICQPTTAAQIFHLLRRQMLRLFRKPLVVLTPKSLLREARAASPILALASGRFQTVIGESDPTIDARRVKRLLICSGKVCYDLVRERAQRGADNVAICRIEQLYPFPHKALAAEIGRYAHLAEAVWVQDEPQNQGAWFNVQHHLLEAMEPGQKLGFAGRPAAASPATGSYARHCEQQRALVEAAFGRMKGFVQTR